MKRAAIVIGVDLAGNLPKLKDAAAGARRFAKWARKQQIDCTDEMLLTDESGPLTIDRVKKAIKKLGDAGTTEQLLIYFAGHGVNIGYNEYWLLSDAPSDPQAAVNVAGSEILARYSGISHVLFISDACRTAAEGIRAQRVSGSEIFPNEDGADLERPVDQFFACTLGRPALEVRDPNTTAHDYSALYTTALLDGLSGGEPTLLDWTSEAQNKVAFVRPRPLKTYLSAALPRRLVKLNLQTKAIQVPDARIVSDPTAWIAQLTASEVASYAEKHPVAMGPPAAALPATAASLSSSLLQSALMQSPLEPALEFGRGANVHDIAAIAATVAQTSTTFGPSHFETGGGFKVRGAKIVEAFSPFATTQLFDVPGDIVGVNAVDPPGASVLLVLEGGIGVVLPVIPQFVTALTIEDAELIDVAFESIPMPVEEHVRALHAVASASTRSGVFRLEGADALAVANALRNAKTADPTLAIYAAYAYEGLQRRDLIRAMRDCTREALQGAQLFDIALLAGELDGKTIGRDPGMLPFVPLLAQSWARLGAHRVRLPESLDGIWRTVLPSVWTMFNNAGVKQLRTAMQKGDAR